MKNSDKLKHWLYEQKHYLIQDLSQVATMSEIEIWFNVLDKALTNSDLLTTLQETYLSIDTLNKLFTQTLSHLSPDNADLLPLLSATQHKIVAVSGHLEIANQAIVPNYFKLLVESNLTLNSPGAIQNQFKTLALNIAKALQADAALIAQFEVRNTSFKPIAHHRRVHKNIPSKLWRVTNAPLSLPQDPIGQKILQTRRPLAIQTKEVTATTAKNQPWTQFGWQSLLVFPLLAEDKVIGLIEVYHHDAQKIFTFEHIQLGKALANQVSLILEQIQLREQTQTLSTTLNILSKLSEQINQTGDTNHHYQILVETAKDITDSHSCLLYTLNQSTHALDIQAIAGTITQPQSIIDIATEENMVSQAVSEKEMIYIPHTSQDKTFIISNTEMQSLLVLPLIFQDTILGAICLGHLEPDAFGKKKIQSLQFIAHQTASILYHQVLLTQISLNQKFHQTVINQTKDGILYLNQQGDIITANAAFGLIVGMSPAEIEGQNIYTNHLDPRLAAISQAVLNISNKDETVVIDTIAPANPNISLQILATSIPPAIGQVWLIHQTNTHHNSNIASIKKHSNLQLIDLLNQVILKLQPVAHKAQVKVVTHFPASLPYVLGNESELELALSTLLSYAIQHSIKQHLVFVEAGTTETSVTLKVADTGEGIATADLPKIFTQFYYKPNTSTVDTNDLTPVGNLYLVKKIITDLQGQIRIESFPGQGNTFFIQLPITN